MKKLLFTLAMFLMVVISFQVDTSFDKSASFVPLRDKTLFYKKSRPMIA